MKMFSVSMRLPRMGGWLVLALTLSALVWAMAPQQLPVSVYKLSLIALAAVVGYWIDRSLFPYARPDSFLVLHGAVCDEDDGDGDDDEADGAPALPQPMQWLMAASMLRRAVIVAACMLGVSLGA